MGSGTDQVVARHRAQVMGTVFSFCLVAPAYVGRRRISEALAEAVAELRAVDTTFSPFREQSLVSRVRRGDLSPESYPPPLVDVISRCNAMRAATDGWFDAWAVPGGFDPSGLVKGWGVERAASRLRAAGISNYAINGGGDIVVRGQAPRGGGWRVGIRHPREPGSVLMVLELTEGAVATSGSYERGGHVINPKTGDAAGGLASATVLGPDLGFADAYATALYAAGPPALSWFPTPDGYHALVIDDELTGTFTDGIAGRRLLAPAA